MSRRFCPLLGRRAVMGSSLAMAAVAANRAMADAYPSKPITLVVPFPAGSVADSISRQFAQYLSSSLKVSVVVDNKAGAGGMLGASVVARAAPDGYTLLTTTNTTHSAVEALFKSVPYDPIKDFTHLARLARVVTVVVVKADSRLRTIQDLVRIAKAEPGKIEYGHGNSSGQVMGETLKNANGLDIVRVSYRGVPQVLNDLVSGQIALAVVDLPSALPLLRAGTIRALAVSTNVRSSTLPEVPTLNETVVPGYDLTPWFGIAGPAGLPAAVIDALGKMLTGFVEQPDVAKRFAELSVDIVWVSPKDIGPFVVEERRKWMGAVSAAGIQPE
ncbi:MAG: tripartite tricarboxylate transporter substrate binding protein [Rhodospirillales bacterium]|nr:tripartite tricarboxylate transporter substrate binding protein [Rhodospirillales bacterium]